MRQVIPLQMMIGVRVKKVEARPGLQKWLWLTTILELRHGSESPGHIMITLTVADGGKSQKW